MRALVQRVSDGSVSIDNQIQGRIGPGLVIFVGVGNEDSQADVAYLVRKTANLRIFADENGKLNYSVKDTGGSVLVVSQFTLYADTSRGNRPGFEPAADPYLADKLYQEYVKGLQAEQIKVETGVFQAYMQVNIANDGPVTILLESPKKGASDE